MQYWYVYFKLPAYQIELTATRVREMLSVIAAATGVQGRLLRRAESHNIDPSRVSTSESNALVTLMEVYERIVDSAAFQSAYDGAVAAAGLSAEQIAARRIERFEDF